jgi:18S rRNA (guanine1575-N7)-methyltransferase
MSRPEHQGPPELYYGVDEAQKYAVNSRIQQVQIEMAERALELLALPDDGEERLILDLGCGSGLSGEVLEEAGHRWVGMDISEAMLKLAAEDEEEVSCRDLSLADMGQGVPFKPGTFDGCISISALQWLCHSNRSWENPYKRLNRLFVTLFGSLCRGARAVFQFYPESPEQIDMMLNAATKAGFTGGLVVDYPNSTKAKKYYLCLMTGGSASLPAARGVSVHDDNCSSEQQQHVNTFNRARVYKSKKEEESRKDFILRKKELYRKRGQDVVEDSKYTGRKRRPKF